MSKLIMDSGEEITEPKQILNEQYKFYADLYRSDPNVKFQIRETVGTTLSEEQKNTLDQEISFEEVTQAVKSFPANKCPGLESQPN